MRIPTILLCLACATTIADAQSSPLLSVSKIVNTLSGRWVMASGRDDQGDPVYDCVHGDVVNIRLTPGETSISYASWHEREPETKYRSIVRAQSANDDVNSPGAIVLQYEGEQELDVEGEPVKWHLLMTDRNTFYWHREDWPNGDTTAPSRRCPNAPAVG